MLNRNDLAKQFEIVVQQEIKNFNATVASIRDSLNSLKDEIKDVREKCEKDRERVLSSHKSLEIQLELHKNYCKQAFEKLESQSNDHKNQMDLLETENENAMDELSQLMSGHNIFREALKIVDLKISSNDQKNNIMHQGSALAIQANLDRMQKDLARTKKEILEAPSEFAEVKKELESKLSSHVVDVDGVLREIRLSGRALMTCEKKIENIYTLIDRLQKKGSE